MLALFIVSQTKASIECLVKQPNPWLQEKIAEKYTVSGYIRDSLTGEELIGATVMVQDKLIGTISNVYGFYSLSLPEGRYDLTFGFIGFQSITQEIELSQNHIVSIELIPSFLELTAIVVKAEKDDENLRSTEMSVGKMDVETIKKLPQVMGEADIIRSIQILPGVTSVGEGAGGFNVRGGGIDQNLVLLDEAPVYNSSHLFGFFSVFNADAIKDIKIYKGGIAPRYGGRLSSVIDVRQKEGNMKKFSGSGGLGMLASRLTLEIPVIKEKSSLLISGRRSYMDVFLKASPEFRDNQLYFYDLNIKGNYKINPKNRVFLSGYFGKDVMAFGSLINAGWGNSTLTLRWNHLFSDKVFSNFTALYSKYHYNLGGPEGVFAFDWSANITNYNLKSDISYFANPNNTFRAGIDVLVYKFNPGAFEGIGEGSIFSDFQIEPQYALEPAIYISNQQSITSNLSLDYGVRYSVFERFGSASIFEYLDDNPTSGIIVDTVDYAEFESIQTYGGLEPRLSANYRINELSSVKASYNRLRQYIHLVSNTSSPLPIDSWTPSGKYIKPSIVDQVALGYFRNFHENMFESSVEVYYKQYKDLLDYKNGAQLFLNEALETQLLSGKGRAYGLELLLKKETGKLTGILSFTLSRTERLVEEIAGGEFFPANSDKLHDLSLMLNYDLSPNWSIATNFAFMSGKPFTYPEARYEFEGTIVPKYSKRNAGRTPAYHRLDIAINHTPKRKDDRKYQGTWNFGVYNAYARQNVYSIFFRQNQDNPTQTEAVQLSIFGTAIPYLTYNFKF